MSLDLLPFLLLILHHTNGQNSPNISIGSTFTAGNNCSLLSSCGGFAFGFYPVLDTLFLVGIWFNKIQERTLVWSANRDSPAETGSTISLTNGGQLVLNYANGNVQQIYSGAARLGIMQDDGNLVLRDIPVQIMFGKALSFPLIHFCQDKLYYQQQNSNSNSNSSGNLKYSAGKFMLEMQYDGKLVLSAYHFADPGYWLSSQANQGNGEVNLVFNQRNALLYLEKGQNNTIYSFQKNVPTPVEDHYHRATLDSFGNFQQYAHHKTNGRNWVRVWKILSEPCIVNAVCGAYGFCRSNDNETVDCECLPGYVFFDPCTPSNGCHPEAMINFCTNLSAANSKVEVVKDSDIPYQDVGDYEHYPDTDEEGCKKLVMDDCYAMAATLVNRTCYKKRTPILNAGKTSMTKGSISFIKVPTKSAKDGISARKKKSNTRAHLTAGLITSSSLAVLFGALALYCHPAPRRLIRRKWNPDSSRMHCCIDQ
ncbi:G-type lectin S-receptor-like serine/threonine-protein kinase LECRK1 [Lycium ferocissimum]|uniref:G-type lectin S-receptor-like serine/threonine-protein kinase LECRK1 n=1 Tax=Lycium ferocissimum TaxID=112874 RepID=UPI0028153A17|nr:G-type lectin S-receptor-like serine/threonine-protein kinase LECRK1 [Lycium ferocissimum]